MLPCLCHPEHGEEIDFERRESLFFTPVILSINLPAVRQAQDDRNKFDVGVNGNGDVIT
jgi:hypothetical protein